MRREFRVQMLDCAGLRFNTSPGSHASSHTGGCRATGIRLLKRSRRRRYGPPRELFSTLLIVGAPSSFEQSLDKLVQADGQLVGTDAVALGAHQLPVTLDDHLLDGFVGADIGRGR